MELPVEIKKIVIEQVKNWPKELDARGLIEILDKFAIRVIETQKILDIAKELKIKDDKRTSK